MQIPEGERERKRSNVWGNNNKEFLQINIKHQTTDSGYLKNIKQDKHTHTKKSHTPECFHFQTSEIKKNSEESQRGKNTLPIEDQK